MQQKCTACRSSNNYKNCTQHHFYMGSLVESSIANESKVNVEVVR